MFENQPKGLWILSLANTGERFGYYTMLAVFALFLGENFGFSAGTAQVSGMCSPGSKSGRKGKRILRPACSCGRIQPQSPEPEKPPWDHVFQGGYSVQGIEGQRGPGGPLVPEGA